MSVTINDITKLIEDLAPSKLAEKWDNVGLLVGEEENSVKKILLALDATDSVVDEAVEKGVNLIITHHPVIFKSMKSVNSQTSLGRRIIKLIRNEISVFSAHTNLDITDCGTNDVLFDSLNLSNKQLLFETDNEGYGLGRKGDLPEEIEFSSFINLVKEKLKLSNINYVGCLNKKIKTVGICTGSCSSGKYSALAKENGCDVYVSGDLSYHDAQAAQELDICFVDATHYGTEVLVLSNLRDYIQEHLKTQSSDIEVFVSESGANFIKTY